MALEKPLTSYIAYAMTDGTGRTRIGHFDAEGQTITPLAYPSGTPLTNLYEVIEVGFSCIVSSGPSIPVSSVKILPPLAGRDVLAVGKNYAEHAKEFNTSGYDASDKVDMPSHPVIFTKRSTSIIAHEEEILPFPEFTSTLDYEGEIGLIIGKTGFSIKEEEAAQYVWGYTIINDVTAREKQRDHKQFYIGKSGDTFCPMGPIAVPKENLPELLKIQTTVNGELRQEATTNDFIFSVSRLIKTISEAQTLRLGDVIATGTPAGVGFGLKPPNFLRPGDMVEIEVTGLGTLRNRVGAAETTNHVQNKISEESFIPVHNRRRRRLGMTVYTHAEERGKDDGPAVVFIHGLGGLTTYYKPLISTSGLETTHRCVLYDLEGHGLSPTRASSCLSIQSYVNQLHDLFQSTAYNLQDGAIIVAHSMGCLIATVFATEHSELVKQLVLISPPRHPLPEPTVTGLYYQAQAVRESGMGAVAETIVDHITSSRTKTENPLAHAAILQSLLSQDEEGYAKGCTALATSRADSIDFTRVMCKTLIVTGDQDEISQVDWCQLLVKTMKDARLAVLEDVGHWAGFEDVEGLAKAVKSFLNL